MKEVVAGIISSKLTNYFEVYLPSKHQFITCVAKQGVFYNKNLAILPGTKVEVEIDSAHHLDQIITIKKPTQVFVRPRIANVDILIYLLLKQVTHAELNISDQSLSFMSFNFMSFFYLALINILFRFRKSMNTVVCVILIVMECYAPPQICSGVIMWQLMFHNLLT